MHIGGKEESGSDQLTLNARKLTASFGQCSAATAAKKQDCHTVSVCHQPGWFRYGIRNRKHTSVWTAFRCDWIALENRLSYHLAVLRLK